MPRVLGLLAVSVLAFLGVAAVQTLNRTHTGNTPSAVSTPAVPTPGRQPNCSVLARADIHPPECPRRPAATRAPTAGTAPNAGAAAARTGADAPRESIRHYAVDDLHITVRSYRGGG